MSKNKKFNPADWPAMNVKLVDIDKLVPLATNARVHNEAQIEQIKKSLDRFKWTIPILVDEDNMIIAGHGRIMAAKEMDMPQVPVAVAAGWDEAEKRAYALLDNMIYESGDWDDDARESEIDAVADLGIDLSDYDFDLYDPEDPDLESDEKDYLAVYTDGELGALEKKYIIPPFTVFDTKKGYWQNRKRAWLDYTGDLSLTKENVLSFSQVINTINDGSSNFDPVLAEIMYRWFCPPGGKILDPFGGEQTKGVIAGHLGLEYQACEIRQDQVDVNHQQIGDLKGVKYHCGDSVNISKIIQDREFDMCFTSPPYYDLEVYSKEDMSALGTYKEFMKMYETIFKQCVEMLADGAFLVVKVGEIRSKKTGYQRAFVADNVKMFQKLGLNFISEIILLNSIGTGAMRANRAWPTRSIIRCHQNVLVFCKGGRKNAVSNLSDKPREDFPLAPFEREKD